MTTTTPPADGAGVPKETSPVVRAVLWTVCNGRCYAPRCPNPVVFEVCPGQFHKNSPVDYYDRARGKPGSHANELPFGLEQLF